MNRLEAALTKLDKEVQDRLAGFSKHLETQVTNIFDRLDKAVETINGRLGETNRQLEALRTNIDALTEKYAVVVQLGERLEAVEKKSTPNDAN